MIPPLDVGLMVYGASFILVLAGVWRRLKPLIIAGVVASTTPILLLQNIPFQIYVVRLVFAGVACLSSIAVLLSDVGLYSRIVYAIACLSSIGFIVFDATMLAVVFWLALEATVYAIALNYTDESRKSMYAMAILCSAPSELALFTLLAFSYTPLGVHGVLEPLYMVSMPSWALVVVVVCLSSKLGLPPFTKWVAEVYPRLTPEASSVLAGLSSLMPILVIYELLSLRPLTIAGTAVIAYLATAGLLLSLYSSLKAISSEEYGVLLAYSSLAFYGLASIALAVSPYTSLEPVLLGVLALYNSPTKTGLFLEWGRVLREFGVARVDTAMASASRATSLLVAGLAGAPATPGLIAKVLLVYCLITVSLKSIIWLPLLAGVVASMILSIAYSIRLSGAYRGSTSKPSHTPIALTAYSLPFLAVASSLLPLAYSPPLSIALLAASLLPLAAYTPPLRAKRRVPVWASGVRLW